MELLQGLAKTAIQTMPDCPQTSCVRGRLKSIEKTLRNALLAQKNTAIKEAVHYFRQYAGDYDHNTKLMDAGTENHETGGHPLTRSSDAPNFNIPG